MVRLASLYSRYATVSALPVIAGNMTPAPVVLLFEGVSATEYAVGLEHITPMVVDLSTFGAPGRPSTLPKSSGFAETTQLLMTVALAVNGKVSVLLPPQLPGG